jgi:hypothetical protein
MSTETKHSPLPWHVATNPGGPEDQPAFPSVRDNSGEPHGMDIVAMPLGNSETVWANARRIVQCVNAHDELVASLTQALAYIEYKTAYQGCMSVSEVEAAVKRDRESLATIGIGHDSSHTLATFDFKAACAALARATGK